MKYDILLPFKDYLHKEFSEKTAKKYYSLVDRAFKDMEINSLKDIEPEYIKQYMAGIRTKNEFSATKQGLMKLNEFDPCFRLPEKEFFRKETRKRGNKPLNQGEEIHRDTIMRKINRVSNPDLRLAYRLAMVSGLRVSELADLRATDVNMTDEQLKVFVRNGKGGKSGIVICLNDDYVKNRLEKLLKRKGADERLFYSISHMMNEANRLGFECHDLRRIFAQDLEKDLKQRGKTRREADKEVQMALRHNKMKTSQIYLKGKKVIYGQMEGGAGINKK
jgi:Site-specific recombinase XerD